MSYHLNKQIEKKLKKFAQAPNPTTEELYKYSDLSNVEKLIYHRLEKAKHTQSK